MSATVQAMYLSAWRVCPRLTTRLGVHIKLSLFKSQRVRTEFTTRDADGLILPPQLPSEVLTRRNVENNPAQSIGVGTTYATRQVDNP